MARQYDLPAEYQDTHEAFASINVDAPRDILGNWLLLMDSKNVQVVQVYTGEFKALRLQKPEPEEDGTT